MSFFDSVNTLLEKNKIKLDYPINIVMGHKNSNFIDIELYEKDKKFNEILKENSIDVILKKKEIVSNDFTIIWEKEENEIHFESENDFTNIFKNISLEKVLNKYKYFGTTEDNKFKIYLFLIPNSLESTEEFQLPNFNNMKYQYLYKYENECQFTNAIYIEFMVRNAEYNNLYSDISIIEENPLPNESEEKFDVRITELLEKKSIENDEILIKHYGFNYDEISNLNLTIFKDTTDSDKECNEFFLSKIPTIKKPENKLLLDLNLPENEFLKNAKELKNIYENQIRIHSNFQEMNKKFKENADIVLNKFPKSFEKKKVQLIKALFIFDYIQAYNKSIDELNISVKKEYEAKKIEINNKYSKKQEEARKEIRKFEAYKKEAANFEEKIRIEKQNNYQKTIDVLEKDIKVFKRNENKELEEEKKELKEKLVNHTKMDPSKYDDSVFNEIASIINEKPKQCTKIHNRIHKFLQKQITN